jgi:hypothetical protein
MAQMIGIAGPSTRRLVSSTTRMAIPPIARSTRLGSLTRNMA